MTYKPEVPTDVLTCQEEAQAHLQPEKNREIQLAGARYKTILLELREHIDPERQVMPPIDALANPDGSHFWLLSSEKNLHRSHDVLIQNGYTPYFILTWLNSDTETEHLLLGARGRGIPKLLGSQINWSCFPAHGSTHTLEEFIRIVEAISPPPYLKIFSLSGWDTFSER